MAPTNSAMSAYSDLNRFSREDKDMSHQKQVKQYAERDVIALDEQGGYYIRHVIAMTREKLYLKSDVAAELAFRDMRIDALTKRSDELLDSLKELLSSKAEHGLFAGVAAADNAIKLVKSIEDAERIGADHSPDAAIAKVKGGAA